MRARVHFAVETYRRDRDRRLVKARWLPCSTAEEAERRAAEIVARGRCAGATAISERNSGEFDEGERPITIAYFGDVPSEARDALPF